MSTRSTAALVVTALALGTCAIVHAQQTVPATEAEIVRLDVVVTDAHGQPVSGLTREDFDVLEDGKPQRLTDFVFVGGAGTAQAPPAPASPVEPTPTTAATAAPARPTRHIAIVVDELHLSRRGVAAAKEVLRRFVDETVAPEDEITLVVTGRTTSTIPPTRDRVAIRQAIARLSARADESQEVPGRQLTAAQAELILRGDPTALKLAARLLKEEPGYGADPPANAGPQFQGKGGVSPRDSVKTSDPTPAGLEQNERSAGLEVQELARAILGEALSISEVSLAALADVLRGMAPLPGRKLCLLVSDGFLVGRGTREERTRPLQQVTDAATRSGMSVYALVAGGVTPLSADASMAGSPGPAGLRERVASASEQVVSEGLRELADDTGGFVLRGSDGIPDGLLRMLRDGDSAYLLAYEPSNRKRDGRFRKIAVRLRGHAALTLRTRRGYFAPDDRKRAPEDRKGVQQEAAAPSPAAPRPFSRADAQLALNSPPPLAGISVRVAADYVELTPGRPQAVVKAQLDPSGLPWKTADGRQRAEFDLIGGVYDASGEPGPIFAGQRYALDVTPAEYERIKQTGIRFEAKVPLRPGRYEIRMLALDPVAHVPLGGGARPIQVPDLAQKKLTLSSVFLASSAASEGVAPRIGTDEALRDVQVLRRFKASDSLYFQVYVYNAARDAAGASDVLLQTQILSAAGRPPFVSKPQRALLQEQDGAPLPEGDGIPLLGLVPGSYELRVVVADRLANAVASRSVDFTVE